MIRWTLAFLPVLVAACTIAPAPETPGSPAGASLLPPPGFGTLPQDEVTMRLASRELEISVTPLDEAVTRATAPDTYRRLAALAGRYRATAPRESHLFLVSFFSEDAGARFVPEEVQLISRGLRMRPLAVLPVTPTWGQRRLRQRQAEMAVYAFPAEVDLESDLLLAYELEETASWTQILARIQAERARARARAGVGS
jgi:hypothetical protein